MNWIPKTGPGKVLAAIAFVFASITAIYGGYQSMKAMGLPTPAWAEDIERLDRGQIENRLSNRKLERNFLLILPKPEDETRQRYLKQQLKDIDAEIDRLRQRRDDLVK